MRIASLIFFFILFSFIATAQQSPDSDSNATINDTTIFTYCEVMPHFDFNSYKNFNDYLMSNFRIPDDTECGTWILYVTFIIEKDGSVSNVKILKESKSSLDNEALRMVSASPKWVAGVQHGQKVRVKQVIRIKITK